MEIRRVGSCGNKHDNKRIGFSAFLITFLNPMSDDIAIRRVAKHSVPPPILFQPVFTWSKVFAAFRIIRQRAWIKIEMKFLV